MPRIPRHTSAPFRDITNNRRKKRFTLLHAQSFSRVTPHDDKASTDQIPVNQQEPPNPQAVFSLHSYPPTPILYHIAPNSVLPTKKIQPYFINYDICLCICDILFWDRRAIRVQYSPFWAKPEYSATQTEETASSLGYLPGV